MRIFKIIILFSLLLGLSNCQNIWKNSTNNPISPFEKNGTYVNHINSGVRYITAKYATEYNLSGNVIALYPDFHIRLISTERKDTETISLYEIASTNGLRKKQIRCTTRDPEKKHVYIQSMHFFYHSEEPGKINIYIPTILLAAQSLNSNNTL